jgi:class 3 adenylate cyclase
MTFPDPSNPSSSTARNTIDLRASKIRVRRSLLCSDIVSFTTLLSRLGDADALQIVRRHDAIVRGCAAAHGGEVLELRGDGFVVSFVHRSDALACAADIQRTLASDRAGSGDGGLHVRIAVHTGELFLERGRHFGLEMVVPFRLLDVAGADEILVSGLDEGLEVSGEARAFSLKGIPRPVRAISMAWCPLEMAVGRASQRSAPIALAAAC